MADIKEILKLALPIVVNLLLFTVISFTDLYVVSKYGVNAVSAVGIVQNILGLLFAFTIVYESGGKVLLTRYNGQKSFKKASIVISSLLVSGLIAAAILTILISIILKIVILFLDKELIEYAADYGYILAFAIPFIIINVIIDTAMHSYSDSKIPMYLALIAAVINIVLDFGLGLGYFAMPKMGVFGVALSTLISYIVIACLHLYIYFSKKMPYIPNLRFNKMVFLKSIKVAISDIGSHISRAVSNLILITAIITLGSIYYASFNITIKVMALGYMPVIAFAIAGSILIGQKIGEKNFKEAEEIIKIIAIINTAYMLILAIFLILYAESLAKIFSSNKEAIEIIKESIIAFAIIEIPFAIDVTYTFALNGAGLTKKTLRINLINIWGFKVIPALIAIYLFKSYESMLIVYFIQFYLIAYLMHKEFYKRELVDFKI